MAKQLEEEKLRRENQSKIVETLKQKEEQLQEEMKTKQVSLSHLNSPWLRLNRLVKCYE